MSTTTTTRATSGGRRVVVAEFVTLDGYMVGPDEDISWVAVGFDPQMQEDLARSAAIAALHAQAPSYAATDWPQVVALYDELVRAWPSPVAELNRVVAVAMVEGPAVALAAVERLEATDRLRGYHYLPATKADLLARVGRHDEAAAAYREALRLAANAAEREFLASRLATYDDLPPAGHDR